MQKKAKKGGEKRDAVGGSGAEVARLDQFLFPTKGPHCLEQVENEKVVPNFDTRSEALEDGLRELWVDDGQRSNVLFRENSPLFTAVSHKLLSDPQLHMDPRRSTSPSPWRVNCYYHCEIP
jgi:hypothetical protein